MNECAKWSTLLSSIQVLLGFALYQHTGSLAVFGFAAIWVLFWAAVFSRLQVFPYAAGAAAWANITVLLAIMFGAVAKSIFSTMMAGGASLLFFRYFIVGSMLSVIAVPLLLFWLAEQASVAAEKLEESPTACFAVLLPYFVGTALWGFISLWRVYQTFIRPQIP